MKLSANGIAFLQAREGFKSVAYSDGTKYTIGYGNTYWEDGSPVRSGQTITKARAESLFRSVLVDFEKDVTSLVTSKINQNQFDALVSYAYNRGSYRIATSTLLKMVNANPNDPNIRKQFETEWGTNATYKTGLINRRRLEAELYFTGGTINAGTTQASSAIWLFGLLGLGIILSKN